MSALHCKYPINQLWPHKKVYDLTEIIFLFISKFGNRLNRVQYY